VKTLIKTDKVIEIDPMNIVNLYKFVRQYIGWKSQDYLNELGKRFPNKLDNYISVEIPLDVVILPSYMLLEVPPTLKNVIKPKHRDAIYPENFSYFDLYKVVDDPNGEITDTTINIGVNYYTFESGVARIRSMLLVVEYLHSNHHDKTLYITTILDTGFTTKESLTKALNSLMWARGRSYSSFRNVDSKLIRKLIMIEENLTLFLNFLYALHTHKFDSTDMASWLFKYYSDLVRGFGCNFEEALSVVEFASALLP
jgi:hypothetical protein